MTTFYTSLTLFSNIITSSSYYRQLTLSQTTNLRLLQTERGYRQQFLNDENCRKFSKQVENTVGKGEIALVEQFLLSPVFSIDLYCRHVKTRACLEKGLELCIRQFISFLCQFTILHFSEVPLWNLY